MNISLIGWIRIIKNTVNDLKETINTINEDYAGEYFDELNEGIKKVEFQTFGFMEDMNNIFANLKDAKTDEEILQWVKDIKEFLSLNDLEFKKTDRTIVNRIDTLDK